MRVVQAGAGSWGASWLAVLREADGVELVGIADPSPVARSRARAATGLDDARIFESLDEALARTEADAVLVATPPETHHDVTVAALAAGRHVLTEKPLATTMADARSLVRAADESGRILMVSQNYRFRRTAQIVTEIMRDGWLGPVHFATVQLHKEMHFVLPDAPHGFAAYTFVRDAAVHHLDQIRACLNAEPVRVYGRQDNPAWSWFTHPPMLCALLELDGGGLVQFYGSWIARGRETSFDGDWHVECANGQLRWEGNRVWVRPVEPWLTIQMDGFVEREGGWMEAEVPAGRSEDRTRVLEVFHECLETGAEPPTGGRDNLRTAALAFALADSARDGAPRELAPYLAPR